ncbi:SDR family NAD(P)-dependent oxidoreductase [Streptacidiphilus sp. PAMC 29251]
MITGAGSGIGRALAENLVSHGAILALSDVDTEGLAETVRRCESAGSPEIRSDRLDVSDGDAVLIYADTIAAHFGRVNQIYNNAGITHYGSVEQSAFADIERIMNVDYWGVVYGTKAFLPHVIASGDGHIVNVSSMLGLMSMADRSAYSSAKFAVRGFTEALRQEMLIARKPIKVTCVFPGSIKTAVARNSTVAEGMDQGALADLFDTKQALHTSEMAAKTIVKGVRKGHARVLIGYEAKALDALVRITGSGYQRILAFGNTHMIPE